MAQTHIDVRVMRTHGSKIGDVTMAEPVNVLIQTIFRAYMFGKTGNATSLVIWEDVADEPDKIYADIRYDKLVDGKIDSFGIRTTVEEFGRWLGHGADRIEIDTEALRGKHYTGKGPKQ